MGLFNRKKIATSQDAWFVQVEGEQLFVGELSYQTALVELLESRGYAQEDLTDRGRPVSESFTARLVPERNNHYDANAVVVQIDNKTVAYLSRGNAARYRTAFGTRPSEVAVVLWVKARAAGIVSVWPARKM